MLELVALTEADAHEISLWRYDPPYDFYDGFAEEVAVMLDPTDRYRAIHSGGGLVGYLCVGPDARVAGQQADSGIDDIGYGFRPDLTGQGIASRWLPTVLDLARDLLHAPTQRVTIAAWNHRSIATARGLGFAHAAALENQAGEWVVLTRAAGPRS